jgi:hypothetical protein
MSKTITIPESSPVSTRFLEHFVEIANSGDGRETRINGKTITEITMLASDLEQFPEMKHCEGYTIKLTFAGNKLENYELLFPVRLLQDGTPPSKCEHRGARTIKKCRGGCCVFKHCDNCNTDFSEEARDSVAVSPP